MEPASPALVFRSLLFSATFYIDERKKKSPRHKIIERNHVHLSLFKKLSIMYLYIRLKMEMANPKKHRVGQYYIAKKIKSLIQAKIFPRYKYKKKIYKELSRK